MAELVKPANRVEPLAGEHQWSGVAMQSPRAGTRTRAGLRSWSAVQRFVAVLALVYIAKQIVYALLFPAFSGHDEVAHFAHLQIVATEHRLPQIPDLTEWRAEFAENREITFDRIPPDLYRYCRYVTPDWFCEVPRFLRNPPYAVTYLDAFYPSGWIYTANHPPLYYVLMTPVYWLTDGASTTTQLYLLRFAAIPFGLMTVLLAFLTARALFPGDGFLAVTVPAFVAFQTQVSYEAAMLNNDILCIALYSLVLYLTVVGIRKRFPVRIALAIGAALGFALLAKSTSITALGLVGIAVLLSVGLGDPLRLMRTGMLITAPLAVLVAPWYAYLYATYGNFTGLSQIKALQWWNNPAGSFFGQLFDLDFAEMRFLETWGWWGWRLIPLSDTALWAIGLPLLVALFGLVLYAALLMRPASAEANDPVNRPVAWQRIALLVLFLTCVVAYLAIIQFGLTFALTQARYYFPAVNAVALLLALGLRTLIPMRFHPHGQGIVVAALVVMNVLIFSQFVIPYWQLSFD